MIIHLVNCWLCGQGHNAGWSEKTQRRENAEPRPQGQTGRGEKCAGDHVWLSGDQRYSAAWDFRHVKCVAH